MLAGEVRAQVRAAIDALPDRQRVVITLRDVLGHTSEEVCEMLEISGANQRVLLHRARAAVRTQLAPYLEQDPAPSRAGELRWPTSPARTSSSWSPTTSRARSTRTPCARFEEHLALCPGCETYLSQMQETASRLGEIPVESLSAETQATLLSAFRDFRR